MGNRDMDHFAKNAELRNDCVEPVSLAIVVILFSGEMVSA